MKKIKRSKLKELAIKYYGDDSLENQNMIMMKISIARHARVSYFNFEGKDDYEQDMKTCDKLFGSVPRHLSPTEHVAQALDSEEYIGNFCGFRQYRYMFADQNLKDDRVVNHGK